MNIISTLKTVVEIDGTDYTLDAALGAFAVVHVYEGLERGAYTYVEYYNDREFATIMAEDAEEIARRQDKLAQQFTAEQLAQYVGGDRLLSVELVDLTR